MRLVLVGLILAALAFGGLMAWSGLRDRSPDDAPGRGGAPPMRNGDVDRDALERWDPPSAAAVMARVTAPAAPRVKVANPLIRSDGALDIQRRRAPPSDDNIRIARFALVGGGAARVEYACRRAAGRECPEVACLCGPGSSVAVSEASSCPYRWVARRERNDRLRCSLEDREVNLVIYPEGGGITIAGIGGPARVRLE